MPTAHGCGAPGRFSIPQSELVSDAWNRLAEVKSGEIVVAKYEYDALNRRTKECVDTDLDGDFDEFRHFYYTDGWQLLETRKSTSENTEPETLQPEYQYVWSLRYMDAPVLRDENKDADDDCINGQDERLYYANDANMNVTALVGTDGTPLERYVYDPYGKVTIYDGTWTNTRQESSYDNSILFCGYYRDNETGLYHVRNRYYHPYFGLITRDPGGYVDGMSLYEYCRSRPIHSADPWGLLDAPITNFGHNFDMIILTATDAPKGVRETLQYAAKVRAEEVGGGTKFGDVYKEVNTPEEFVKAVKERHEQVNQGKTEKRCLRIMVAGHGSPTGGPYVGKGVPHESPESEKLLPYPPDPDTGRMTTRSEAETRPAKDKAIKKTAAGTPLGQLKGVVDDVTFTNCGIAAGEGAGNLDTYAQELDMNITAPTRAGTTAVADNGDITFTPDLFESDTSDKASDYIHHSSKPTPGAGQ